MIYVQLNGGIAVFEGISEETVNEMLLGQKVTFAIIDKDQYETMSAEIEARETIAGAKIL